MDPEPISPQPEPVIPPSDSLARKFRPILILAAVILLVAVGTGGIILGKSLNTSQSSTPPTVTPALTQIPTPTPDITTNWETFSSNFGFSLKIPQNFEVSRTGMKLNEPESKDSIRIFPRSDEPLKGPHMKIVVFVGSTKILKVMAQENFDLNINHPGIPASIKEEIKESVFLGNKSYEYTFQNKGAITPQEEYLGYEGLYKFIWTEKSGKQFMIMYTKTSEFDQILSTFKVTSSVSESKSGNGMVSGKLCYPSDFIPEGRIAAKNLSTGEIYYQNYVGTQRGGKTTYSFELKPGKYNLRLEPGGIGYYHSGYYTSCSIGGTTADACYSSESHASIPVEVIAGQTTDNIDLCDFYYLPENAPSF